MCFCFCFMRNLLECFILNGDFYRVWLFGVMLIGKVILCIVDVFKIFCLDGWVNSILSLVKLLMVEYIFLVGFV